MSPVVAAEAAYPERQAAALLTNASVLKVSLRRDSFFYMYVIPGTGGRYRTHPGQTRIRLNSRGN